MPLHGFAFAILLFHSILFGDRTLFFGDIALYFVPLLAFQKSELLLGRVPLWNPRIFCGTPFVGNPQSWPLYPTSLLLYLLRPERAIAFDGVLHLIWAAVGTFVFLRRRRLDRISSLFAALAWGFGGALVSKMQFPNMVQAASYLPWLLWGVDRLIDDPCPARAGSLAILTGLALLASHPQMFLMQGYVTLGWTFWRVSGRAVHSRRRVALLGCAAALLGVGLASIQLFPVVQMVRTSVRSELTLAKANRFILPPYAALTNFIAPNFYGNPATTVDYIARGNFWEPCAYAGIMAFCLGVGACVSLFRGSAEVRFWTLTAAISVWLALGRDAGLFAAVFHLAPGVSKFHDAARWLQPATFALACLGAHGMNALNRVIKAPRLRVVFGAAVLVANTADLGSFAATLNPTAQADLFPDTKAPALAWRRAYYADERLLWARFISYRSYDTVLAAQSRSFVAAQGPNLTTLCGYNLVNGYDPVHSARMDVVLNNLSASDKVRQSGLLADAGSDVLICLDRSTNKPIVQTIPESRGRAWLGGSRLNIRDVTPDKIDISLPTSHGQGNVVIADAMEPGWNATVDGVSRPVDLTNGAFRSVTVNETASEVSLRYEPVAWRLGAFLTFFASGILSVTFGNSIGRRLTTFMQGAWEKK